MPKTTSGFTTFIFFLVFRISPVLEAIHDDSLKKICQENGEIVNSLGLLLPSVNDTRMKDFENVTSQDFDFDIPFIPFAASVTIHVNNKTNSEPVILKFYITLQPNELELKKDHTTYNKTDIDQFILTFVLLPNNTLTVQENGVTKEVWNVKGNLKNVKTIQIKSINHELNWKPHNYSVCAIEVNGTVPVKIPVKENTILYTFMESECSYKILYPDAKNNETGEENVWKEKKISTTSKNPVVLIFPNCTKTRNTLYVDIRLNSELLDSEAASSTISPSITGDDSFPIWGKITIGIFGCAILFIPLIVLILLKYNCLCKNLNNKEETTQVMSQLFKAEEKNLLQQ